MANQNPQKGSQQHSSSQKGSQQESKNEKGQQQSGGRMNERTERAEQSSSTHNKSNTHRK